MTLTNSTVIGNSTTQAWSNGGGIYNSGAVTLDNSTVSDNSTAGFYSFGGGIYNSSAVTLANSTLSDNSTAGEFASGGGIYDNAGSTLTLALPPYRETRSPARSLLLPALIFLAARQSSPTPP